MVRVRLDRRDLLKKPLTCHREAACGGRGDLNLLNDIDFEIATLRCPT